MNPIRAIKTLNLSRYRNTGLALVVMLVAWSFWLPYFVPILVVTGSGLTREGDRVVMEIATQKYLPCVFTRGVTRFHAPGHEPVPVELTNYYNGQILGKGALKVTKEGEEYSDFPLFWDLPTRVYADLPANFGSFDVDKSYFTSTFVYRCNSFNNEYQKHMVFPYRGANVANP